MFDADFGAEEADRLGNQLQQDAGPASPERGPESLGLFVLGLPDKAARNQLGYDAPGGGAVEPHLARQIRPA